MHAVGRASFGVGGSEDAWRVEFEAPAAIEEAWSLEGVREVVQWSDGQSRSGRFVVLLLSYEAAPAFDSALLVRSGQNDIRPDGVGRAVLPLAWAASYDAPVVVPDPEETTARVPDSDATGWTPAIDESRFASDIHRVLGHIAAGDTYQVNYTFPLTAPFPHDPWQWFVARARQARVPYPACIDLGPTVVMSLSPELFVERRGNHLSARPMKGTVRRGRWLAEDERLADALTASEKARAENVMIVDLLRNDIGRVAQTGSVRVSDLCKLERYPTVWQLTSRIDATLVDDTTLWDVLRAVFPCGSVTGAPKVRTMEIIAELESSPRGIYTGAICLLQPGGDMVASVPIRTAVLDRATGTAMFHVGAGITADSTATDEWAECLAKARVAQPAAVPEDAALFETLRLEDGTLVRRAGHLRRLFDSATLFGWGLPIARLEAALADMVRTHPAGVWRVRFEVDRHGDVRTRVAPFRRDDRRWRVAISPRPVDARSPLLFNKTTRRDMYEAARAAVAGVDDVLLWNSRGELTEATIANVVVELDGRRVTPPIACGLLPGVFRQQLLAQGEVVEQVVLLDDLARASRLWLINSLREWIDADLVAG